MHNPKLRPEVNSSQLLVALGSLDLCHSALEFLAKKLEPSKGIHKLTWPFRHGEIKEMLTNIERLKTLILLVLQSSLTRFMDTIGTDLEKIGVDAKEVLAGISNIQGNQKVLQAGLIVLTSAADEGQRQQIADWLSPINSDEQQKAFFSKCTPGTGKWFIEGEMFVRWRSGNSKVLWCPGDAGVGKTVLMYTCMHLTISF